jgi:hypothetical protein
MHAHHGLENIGFVQVGNDSMLIVLYLLQLYWFYRVSAAVIYDLNCLM